jgi:hypothetical protein
VRDEFHVAFEEIIAAGVIRVGVRVDDRRYRFSA